MDARTKGFLSECLAGAMKANDGAWAARVMKGMEDRGTKEECNEMLQLANELRDLPYSEFTAYLEMKEVN